MDFCGLGQGLDGIRFNSGALLVVEHCRIHGFVNNGLEVSLGTNAGQLVMKDVQIDGGAAGVMITSAAPTFTASLENLAITGAGIGVLAQVGVTDLTRSLITMSATYGIQAASATTCTVSLAGCTVTNNGSAAVNTGAGGTIRVSNDGVYDNQVGLQAAGGALASDGGNRVAGTPGGSAAPTVGITLK
jgi:hypothetical protein